MVSRASVDTRPTFQMACRVKANILRAQRLLVFGVFEQGTLAVFAVVKYFSKKIGHK